MLVFLKISPTVVCLEEFGYDRNSFNGTNLIDIDQVNKGINYNFLEEEKNKNNEYDSNNFKDCVKNYNNYLRMNRIELIEEEYNCENCAVVTFISRNDQYIDGVRVLGRSLRETNSKFNLVVMVTRNVNEETRNILENDGFVIREVDSIMSPLKHQYRNDIEGNVYNNAVDRYQDVYTKLRVWELIEYHKIIFLDADMILLKNFDELLYCTDPSEFYVTPDCCDYFNSGTMVLSPSLETFNDMISKIAILPSYDGGDQGFLNEYYKETWKPISYIYNAQQTNYYENPIQWDLHKIKVIHYEGLKPWKLLKDKTIEQQNLHSYWWNIYHKLDE